MMEAKTLFTKVVAGYEAAFGAENERWVQTRARKSVFNIHYFLLPRNDFMFYQLLQPTIHDLILGR